MTEDYVPSWEQNDEQMPDDAEPEPAEVDPASHDDAADALEGMGDGVPMEPEPEPSTTDKIMDAARSTEPHTPLGEMEAPVDVENGGVPRIFRALQKMAGVKQNEAWLDLALGMVEVFAQQQQKQRQQNSESESGESAEEDIEMVKV